MKAATPDVDRARRKGFVIAGILAIPLCCVLFLGLRSAQQEGAKQAEFWNLARQSREMTERQSREYDLSHPNGNRNTFAHVRIPSYSRNVQNGGQSYNGAAPPSGGYMAEQDQAAQNALDGRKAELQSAIQQWCSDHSQGAYSYSLYSYAMTSDSEASFSVVGRNNESRADAMLDGGATSMMPGMTYQGSAVYGASGWSVSVMGL